MWVPQRTVAHAFEVTGLALHGGQPVHVRLLPAGPNEGITFHRVDLPGHPKIAARADALQGSCRSTTLAAGTATVRTVEHLLAAAFGLGVDNLLVEVDGPELPVGDGSAQVWVDGLLSAGIVALPAARQWRSLKHAVVIEEAEAGLYLLAAPAASFEAIYVFHPPYPDQPVQVAAYGFSPADWLSPNGRPLSGDQPSSPGGLGPAAEEFIRQVAPARTLAFAEELDQLTARGLGRGVGPDQVVLLGPDGPLGPTRFPDEAARHKLLDLLGDLSLAGPILARLVAIRSGHRHTASLVRQVASAVAEQRGILS